MKILVDEKEQNEIKNINTLFDWVDDFYQSFCDINDKKFLYYKLLLDVNNDIDVWNL